MVSLTKRLLQSMGAQKHSLYLSKNKAKLFTALEQCSNKKKLRESDYKRVDHVVFKCFLSKRSQDIPIDDAFTKEKALQYAKELGFNEFQASDGWLRRWKER